MRLIVQVNQVQSSAGTLQTQRNNANMEMRRNAMRRCATRIQRGHIALNLSVLLLKTKAKMDALLSSKIACGMENVPMFSAKVRLPIAHIHPVRQNSAQRIHQMFSVGTQVI